MLLLHSKKNVITCQKKSLVWDKKINFVFCASQIFYINLDHVDLLRSDLRTKETFNASFTHLSDTKGCPGKKVFLLSRFNACKTSVKGLYFSKNAGFFLSTFAKINTVTGIF